MVLIWAQLELLFQSQSREWEAPNERASFYSLAPGGSASWASRVGGGICLSPKFNEGRLPKHKELPQMTPKCKCLLQKALLGDLRDA